jgi:alkylated DNA repair dioxygenase AlkB
MDLFSIETPFNILPFDGITKYYGPIIKTEEANHYYNSFLNEIEWKHDEARIFGKHFITNRKIAWYAEQEFPYTYSGATRLALPFTETLNTLRKQLGVICNCNFNACLLNLYHNGNEGMAWHSDDERALEKGHPIASLSLGAERRFLFRHKLNGTTIPIQLENGSLLVMETETQDYWLHRLPKALKIKTPRINLTFRKML